MWRCIPFLTAVGLPFVSAPAPEAPLPAGFARVTAATRRGPVSVVLPRREYRFEPAGRTLTLARDGDDAGDGSKERPWATFAHAVGELQPGDLLYVRGGAYPEPFVVRKSGEPGRPIILSAYPGERVRITQPAGWQKEHVHEGNIVLAGAKHVWVHGFEVEGCLGDPDAPPDDTYGQNGITLAGRAGEGVRILNNVVSRAQHCGIKEMGHGGTHFLIEGNVVFDCGAGDQRDHGLYIPASEAVIRGNAVFGSKGYGLHLYDHPRSCQVYDNVFFDNRVSGIIVAGAGNVVAHNVCAENERSGLFLFRRGCVDNTFVNNVLVGNRRGQVEMDDGGGRLGAPERNTIDSCVIFPETRWAVPPLVAGWAGAGMRFLDPRVVDAAAHDYRLSPDSPARGMAADVKLNGASAWPDAGLFPATRYTDPAW